jgi:hypothetical protein
VPLVVRDTGQGLVVAEEAADEAQLGRALKEIDDRYVLQKHPGEVPGGWVYKVFCIVSEDQPAVCILTWANERGDPLELSSGLIDEVKRWRPEARGRRGPDADARNERLLEQTERDREARAATLADDHAAGIVRGRVSVSMGPRPRKPGFQRRGKRPSSGGGRP